MGLTAAVAMVASACQSRTASLNAGSLNRVDAWSEEAAIAILESGTQNPDPSIRAAAVSHWIESEHPSSHRVLPWVMADPSAYVQRAAARAVTGTSTRPVVHEGTDPVAQLFLGQLDAESTWMDATLAAIAEGFPPVDPAALEAIVLRPPSDAGSILVRGVSVAEESMQLPMALAAVRIDAEGSSQALSAALENADEELRIAAIEGLVVAPPNGRSRVWLERASKRGNSAATAHARLALMALGDRPLSVGIDALNSPDRDTRAWAIECMEIRSKDQPLPREVIAQIQGSLRDESPMVRRASIRALIAAAGVEFVPLRAEVFESELDAVSMMIAGKWLAYRLDKAVE